ncbi:MAG: cytochrome c maturation protein CcmE [Thiotrichales bacterium]|nr:cytochrome c maturation protein CcmE [Thiotrichales bacterium]
MNRRRQRMIFVCLLVAGVTAATGLVIAAMGENMLYFYSPTQIRAGEAPSGPSIRVGGLVVEGSVRRGQGTEVSFSLTDGAETVDVSYTGILPDLFREGQGIVASGILGSGSRLRAEEVLAKHDENYMPPEVAEAMEMAKRGGKMAPHRGGQE